MREMTAQEARDFVAHNKAGVLCLAAEGRAYGIPFFYGYDGRDLYFHTHSGLKQRFIVETTEACFTIVRAQGLDDWASVQVFGPIRAIEADLSAQHALMSVPLPPAWGETPGGAPARDSWQAVLYKLEAHRISGRFSVARTETKHAREMAYGGV